MSAYSTVRAGATRFSFAPPASDARTSLQHPTT
jgi:hypothetical protein